MKNRIVALTILLAILLTPAPNPALADVAPPPLPVIGGLGTFDYQKTNVQMTAERVEMEYAPYKVEDGEYSFYRQGVTVNAWFSMRNTGSQDETMQVVFPLENMNGCRNYDSGIASYTYLDFLPDTFQAQVNGHPVETTSLTTDHPHYRKPQTPRQRPAPRLRRKAGRAARGGSPRC